jgi:molecular chaperone DnaK (HSP70)
VVSFLETPRKDSRKEISTLFPHPSNVVVGQAAKTRIDSHPHHTFYHAKRVLGRPVDDPVIQQVNSEVAFDILTSTNEVQFAVPQDDHSIASISPAQIGSYVVHHLMQITAAFLGHSNVMSAVICVPAKFTALQRQATVDAFRGAGVKVTRILEEPTAAALAYGLHEKEGVDFILVYDFGGGTLDVSLLQVTKGFADVMGSDGDDLLGGADFDAAVATHLMQIYGSSVASVREALGVLSLEEDGLACNMVAPLCTRSSFHTIGEQLKIQLSDFPNGGGTVHAACLYPTHTNPTSLDDFCSSLTTQQLSLSSEMFDAAVQSLYDRSILPVQRLLKDLDLGPSDIDEVVMVGGTTRMPQIRRLVKEEMKVESLNTHIDPDLTVAYGAASVID